MGTETQSRSFDDFVRRQQESAAENRKINWHKERDEWLSHLNDLYEQIESFLGEYISAGRIRREYKNVTLSEDHLGSYTARKMMLKIGRQQVNLIPIGTLLIGSKGRVDVVGPAGRAQLLLVDSQSSSPASQIHVRVGMGGKLPPAPYEPAREIEWAWRIVTRPPQRKFAELTQKRLFDLIMEVTNG